jgi:hypothetical protein
MDLTRRKRRSRLLVAEGLESRALLNAALPSPSVAEVHALTSSVPKLIKGTIHAHITGKSVVAPGVTVLTYSGYGNAGLVGAISVSGHHKVSTVAGRKLSTDSYSAGSATLASSVVTIDVTYSGFGHTKANGSSSATLAGTAIAVAGMDVGLSGTFTAQLTGNTRTGAFTITFTLRT